METTTAEIAPDVFRISTYVPDGPPGGVTFNQFLINGTEPLLFTLELVRSSPWSTMRFSD